MDDAAANRQVEATDAEHLKLLAIFHYVVGGLTILFSSFFIVHVVMGIVMVVNPEVFRGPEGTADIPRWLGYVMAIGAGCFVLAGWTMGVLTIYSGRSIARRRRRLFSMVVAGIICLWFPFGTVLGVFTLVVLMRQSVMRLYGE